MNLLEHQLKLFEIPPLRDPSPHCRDCGINCGVELPMLKDEVWPREPGTESAPLAGVLCRPCLERRLGRPLRSEDLPPTPPPGHPWWWDWNWGA
jgi:hypothetical protein